MLPDYLVDKYDLVTSSSELKSEFNKDELDNLCHCLGTSIAEIESVDWDRYVWNKGYVIYPEDHSKIRNGNVYVVLYEELNNDATIEAVIGTTDHKDTNITSVTVFGPVSNMNPLDISVIDRDCNKLYRDMRYILKFLVKMDQYSRDNMIQLVRKSFNEFFDSLDYI